MTCVEVSMNQHYRLLTQHARCGYCGDLMPGARYGRRWCSADCRREGKAEEQRAARRLWRESGRPTFEEERP